MTLPSYALRSRLAALLLASATGGLAAAQTAPACDTIRLIEPYPPGGSTGVVARIVAQKLSADLGQTVIVENRPGASGNIGSAYVAKAKPDGCTLLIGTDATHAGNFYLFKDFPYHPIDDFTPITMAARNVLVLVAHPSFPAGSIPELIAHAKAKPGALFYGSSGIGSPHHLSGALFDHLAGTQMTHVPYAGNAPSIADLVGGQIGLVYSSLTSAEPHIKAGKIKPLGVTQRERYAGLPDTPAIHESLPDFEMTSWLGFFAPAGLPPPLLDTISQSMRTALQEPKTVAQLAELGLVVEASDPQTFAAQQKETFTSRGELIQANDIRAD